MATRRILPELLLAKTLAAIFTPRSQGEPLAYRRLPDGGMTVITADGRKLHFEAKQVAEAEQRLARSGKKRGRK